VGHTVSFDLPVTLEKTDFRMTSFHSFVEQPHIVSIAYDQVIQQDNSLELLRHRRGPVFYVL